MAYRSAQGRGVGLPERPVCVCRGQGKVLGHAEQEIPQSGLCWVPRDLGLLLLKGEAAGADGSSGGAGRGRESLSGREVGGAVEGRERGPHPDMS